MGDHMGAEGWNEGPAPSPMPRAAQEYLVEKYAPSAGFMPFEQEPARPEELPAGTVLGFTKRYREDGPGYSFVAIRVGRRGWYLTGPNYAGTPVEWDTLLDFIGKPDDWVHVGVVTGWTPLVVR